MDVLHHDPAKQLSPKLIAIRVIALAQAMAELRFYPYQTEFGTGVLEALLEHDGEEITCLMSRQAGKTSSIAGTVSAAGVILPYLAKMYADDWRLNITDNRGVYRGFAGGLRVGIYAPRLDQSELTYQRVQMYLDTDTARRVLSELKLGAQVFNGNRIRLSNGTHVLCESASEQSKIEGETHNLVLLEEAQDISDIKIKKSISPMVSSTLGTICKIGTASAKKCNFYETIKRNERQQLVTRKRRHFFFPFTICQEYNSLYKKYIESEKAKLGEHSDEFKMSYGAEFIFERGMFITQEALLHPQVALTHGPFSEIWTAPYPVWMKKYSIVAGIDWGKIHDSTVVTLTAVDWTNPVESLYSSDMFGEHKYECHRKHIIGWMEFQGDNYEIQLASIIPVLRSIPTLKKVILDSNTAGMPLYDRIAACFADTPVFVEPFNFQPRVKSEAYKMLSADLHTGRVTFPASPKATATIEHQRFIFQMTELLKSYHNGLMVVTHPEEKGAHDDYPDSLVIANWGANTPVDTTLDFLDHNPFFR